MTRFTARCYTQHLLLSLLSVLWMAAVRAEVDTVEVRAEQPPATANTFDAANLRRRGLDPQLAQHFARARFPPGPQPVTLFVNGAKKASATAQFSVDGELCIDRSLLQAGGLQMPNTVSTLSRAAEPATALGCADFIQAYPNTVVELKPNAFEVHLIVPTQALVAPAEPTDSYQRGGTAALLNYELLTSRSDNAGTHQDFKSLNTLAGLNLGDWLLRSRQTYSDSGAPRTSTICTPMSSAPLPALQPPAKPGKSTSPTRCLPAPR